MFLSIRKKYFARHFRTGSKDGISGHLTNLRWMGKNQEWTLLELMGALESGDSGDSKFYFMGPL